VPWEFHPELLYKGRAWWQIILYIFFGTVAGCVVGFFIAMRTSKRFNKAVRESAFFRNTGLANNPVIRKSLAMPPLDELSELSYLYDQDEKQAESNGMDSLSMKSGAKYT
jgi:hypothetical protein